MATDIKRRSLGRLTLPALAIMPSYRPHMPLIGVMSYEATASDMNHNTTLPASAAWPTASLAIAFPFQIGENYLCRKAWWFNGTTATTNNVDVGVYTEAGVRLVSGGGTLAAGANVVQEVDVTDTLLVPGRYWCAMAVNGITYTPVRFNPAAPILRSVGVAQMATAYPLPSTFTPAAAANAYLPWFGIANRLQVA